MIRTAVWKETVIAAQKTRSQPPGEFQTFVDARKKPGLFFFHGDSLAQNHVYKVRQILHGKTFEQLDLIIHSGGGDVHAAYLAVELLRMHTKRLNACVPVLAKSAATLLCLGCDTIVLDELAELGQLDTQLLVEKKAGKPEFTSALNPFKTLEQLQKFSLETLDMGVKMVAGRSGMGLDASIKHAIEFVGVTTGPLFSKLDPEKLGEYSRALAVGKDYAERLTRRYRPWDDEKRSQVLEKLVHGYPSHEYIIDYHELTEIGIEAELFVGAERDACRQLLGFLSKRSPFIELIEPTPAKPKTEDATNDQAKTAV